MTQPIAWTEEFGLLNGIWTIESPKGGHRTFKVQTQPKKSKFAPGQRVVYMLTGPNNSDDWTPFGFMSKDGREIYVWKKYRDTDSGFYPKAAKTLLSLAQFREEAALHKKGYRLLGEAKCMRCGRRLTTPESIERGIGPECAKKGVTGGSVGSVYVNEIDEMVGPVVERLNAIHQIFESQLKGRLRYGKNPSFLAEMLDPVFVEAFNAEGQQTLAPTSKYIEPYPDAVREWLKDLAEAVAGYSPDWTENYEANHIHDLVLKAPSIESLLDGSYRVNFSSIIGHIRPYQFRAWHEQGSDTIAELAVDAALYTADIAGAATGFLRAFVALQDPDTGEPIPPEEIEAEDLQRYIDNRLDWTEEFLRNLDDPNHPIQQWTFIGDTIQEKFREARSEAGLSAAKFDTAIRDALALPSSKERGMTWLKGMKPLEVAQAVWLYESMYAGAFSDGDLLLEAALGE